jgi:hypothetical protein
MLPLMMMSPPWAMSMSAGSKSRAGPFSPLKKAAPLRSLQ